MPLEAWIAMGLQDEESGAVAGHYNGYNRQTYIDNGYDSQRTKEQARSDIKEALRKFKNEPQEVLDFL